MDKSLIDYLKQIPDCRDPHGLRHPLWLVLLIIIMGMMSGYWGYRQLGRESRTSSKRINNKTSNPQS